MSTSFPLHDVIVSQYLNEGDTVSSVIEINGYSINSKNYKLVSSKGEKESIHVKIIYNYNPDVIKRVEIFRKCFEKGVKVAQIFYTKEGESFVKGSDYLIICFYYYDGISYSGEEVERISAAKELGRLNRSLSDIKTYIPRNRLYEPLSDSEFSEIERTCKRDNQFDKEVLRYLDLLQEMSQKISTSHYSGDSSNGLTFLEYIDYHPGNVLFRGGNVLAIVDFDSICSVPRRSSVAFATDRFSSDIKQMIDFIRAYRKTDNDLTEEDIVKFPDLIIYEAMSRINYILRSYYFLSSDVWNFDYQKHLNIITKTLASKENFLQTVYEKFS